MNICCPSQFSSAVICLLMAPCVTPSSEAAAVRLGERAATAKALKATNGNSRAFILGLPAVSCYKISHICAIYSIETHLKDSLRCCMPELYAAQAIIFDLDGTVVDSAGDLRAALNILLKDQGFRSIEANEIKAMIGDGVLKL